MFKLLRKQQEFRLNNNLEFFINIATITVGTKNVLI